MNTLANAWNHPRTSIAGLLIATVTIAEVLSRQGVTLGAVGSGTVVTLIGAIATAILGLLAKDPGQTPPPPPSATSTSAKLGVWALIALLCSLPSLTGCSGSKVAQDIVNWTPALQSAVASVDSTAALLAPGDAPIFNAATAGFDAASNLLVIQAKAYLANPSATTLGQIQIQVVAFQQQVDAALLQTARIVNPASQQHALYAVQAVATIVNAIMALVQSVSSKTAVAAMALQSTIKHAQIEPYLDRPRSARIVADHYGESLQSAALQIADAEHNAAAAGL